MQYTITKLPKSEIEIRVELPFSEFEPHVRRAATLISKEREIEGFRRGKAPYDVIQKQFGETAIYERAANSAVQKLYSRLIDELVTKNEITQRHPPIGTPKIKVTKLAPGNELLFSIMLTMLPEVTLPDYKKIAWDTVQSQKKEIAVSEEEIESVLSWIRESRTKKVPATRAAAEGDAAEIDFTIRHQGILINSGESRNHPLIIGKEKFLPGFENQLIGMQKDEKKTFSLVAPDDWHDKELAGKTLDFEVIMRSIEERQIPELTDEFAKNIGKFSSVSELRQNIHNGVLQEKKEKESQRIQTLIIEEVARRAAIEVPETLIISELEKMLTDLKIDIENTGIKWEDYLLHIKKTDDELQKDMREEAKRRVRIALCLGAIASQEHITVPEEELQERTAQYLQRYKTVQAAKQAIDSTAMKEYVQSILKNEKVLTFLEKRE